jgi:adenylylsulfate kinase
MHNQERSGSVTKIKATNITWHEGHVDRAEREKMLDHRGALIWFTGLSASGKSTIAYTLEHALDQRGHLSYVLDGDNIRHGLNKNLGFSAEDRKENIRRIGEVGKLFVDAGLITLTAFISPYKADREVARATVGAGDFFEVFCDTPLAVCEERDPKGLYKKARAGEIKGFTGIDDPYEAPDKPEMVIDTSKMSPQEATIALCDMLERAGKISALSE